MDWGVLVQGRDCRRTLEEAVMNLWQFRDQLKTS